MNDQPQSHDHPREPGAQPLLDAGSQALSEALRSSFAIVKVVMVVLVLAFLGSGFFTVGPQERAIVLRLGRPQGEGDAALLGPGLHFSLPYPIDEVYKVSITGIQKVSSTIGWYATTAEMELAGTEPPPMPSLNPALDSYALTADGNIVHTRATLTYHIEEPIRYVFDFTSASNSVQNALNNSLLYAASRFDVDAILTGDVIGFREAVRRHAAELVQREHLGIVIEQCDVRSIPPRQCKEAFANVLKAEISRGQVLNTARSYENQVLSKASTDAKARINLAESARVRLVTEVASRAEQFQVLLPQYTANPKLFVEQRLAETVGRVLTNAQDKLFIAEGADGNSRQLRLLLNRDLPKQKTEETK